ncbi:hypothetical protein T484DRAFT_1888413 [Baffinella frigidus]|nr:hypothetical protein T484DRAFT_1888413 [Cryptophyta sp. CCMP2293]
MESGYRRGWEGGKPGDSSCVPPQGMPWGGMPWAGGPNVSMPPNYPLQPETEPANAPLPPGTGPPWGGMQWGVVPWGGGQTNVPPEGMPLGGVQPNAPPHGMPWGGAPDVPMPGGGMPWGGGQANAPPEGMPWGRIPWGEGPPNVSPPGWFSDLLQRSAPQGVTWKDTPWGGGPPEVNPNSTPPHGVIWAGGPPNAPPAGVPWGGTRWVGGPPNVPPHGTPPHGMSWGGGHRNVPPQGTPLGEGQPTDRQVTAAFKNCRSLGELARILHEQGGALNDIHVSAAWGCLVRIGAGQGGGQFRDALAALQDRTMHVLGKAGGRAIANVIYSMAKLQQLGKKADRRLLQAMQRRATATAGKSNPQNVSNLLWGLATIGGRADRGLLEAMQRRATATAGEFNPQGVANLLWVVLWGLAVMGEGLDGSLVGLIDLLAARVLEVREKLTPKDKLQLHQWLLSCELDLVSGASLPSSAARVKQELGEECLQAFSSQGTRESQFQRDVALALRTAVSEVEIEEEYCDARSGYNIDVLVRRRSAAGSTEWAVEVDGPSHFLYDSRTPSGSTLLKRKQLGQLGYTVVPVPFWEWAPLRDGEAKRRYLEDKLGGDEKQ